MEMNSTETTQPKGMTDAQESTGAVDGQHGAPPIVLDPHRKLGSGPIVGLIVVALVLGGAILFGILSRVHAEEALTAPTHWRSPCRQIPRRSSTRRFMRGRVAICATGMRTSAPTCMRGQVLAEIQTPELDQQVQQAQSDLATAQANQNIAQITEERWKKLLAKNAVSKQEADQALSDLSAKTSALASAQANVRRVQQLQAFEKVYAPFDGVITARNIDVGSLIQAGDSGSLKAGDSGSLKAELFHMAATDKLRLFVPVPEVYAGNVHNGDRVAVTSDATPNEKFFGTIVRDSNAIDISSRTLNVEVDVNNKDHKLRPGQYAFVHLPIPPANTSMTLPSNVLLFRAEGLQVGVVRNNPRGVGAGEDRPRLRRKGGSDCWAYSARPGDP